MPEGASPDYNCFVWGQNINGVPIWFNVNYNGVTGYYASFYDDSSYQSNEELTAKYGVHLCGTAAAPPSGPPPPSAESPSAPPASPPAAAPAPAAVYFSPYKRGAENGRFEFNDGATKLLYVNEWETKWCSKDTTERKPDNGYKAAVNGVPGRPITTIAGWSNGRVGVMSYLAHANKQQLQQLDYVLLIDPGYYGQMECERQQNVGGALVRWLRADSNSHLVVISTSEISQQENSRGIQETYFNAIRNSLRRDGGDLNSRVLTCNYDMRETAQDTGHEKAFFSSWYWIQHQIGKTRSACPWLSLRGTRYEPTAGWHPIN